MTRLIYNNNSKTFDFQDKFLWFWIDRTAQNDQGDDLPCLLIGFDTIEEAIKNAQSDFYIHESCFEFIQFI